MRDPFVEDKLRFTDCDVVRPTQGWAHPPAIFILDGKIPASRRSRVRPQLGPHTARGSGLSFPLYLMLRNGILERTATETGGRCDKEQVTL